MRSSKNSSAQEYFFQCGAINARSHSKKKGKVCLESRARSCTPCKSLPEFGGRFTPPCKSPNQISDNVLLPMQKSASISGISYPTVQKSKPNLRQGFAPHAKVCQNSGHFFTPCGMACPKSQAYNSDLYLNKNTIYE